MQRRDAFSGPQRSAAVRYNSDYPADATPLSPSLSVVGGEYTHADVAPFIAGLLPDNDQVLDRWGRLFGVSPRNAFAILTHVGSDCAGAVQFVPSDSVGELDSGALEPLTVTTIAQMLRDLRTDPYTWQQPSVGRGGHFSLAGAQTKFALHRTTDGWARPSGRIPTTHIFKPAIPGIAHHDLNEHLCLQAARRLGLLAASSELARFDDERVLVVERYDRRRVDGKLRRLHQVDMCQALGMMPDLKYQRDGGPSPADIITTIHSVFAGTAAIDRFVRALVFNWLIAGTDAHAKNYGLVLSGTNAGLAPLYDVSSALMMPEWNWHKWELAMRINKQGRFKYLRIEDWKKFATSAGVDFAVIEGAIATYASTIVEAVADAARPMDLDADERAFVARFTDALAEHISRVVGR